MAQAKIYNQSLRRRRLLLGEIHIQQIKCVCAQGAQPLTCKHISLCRVLTLLRSLSLSLTVGVQGVLGAMALCSEACVSGSGGESSGSEVSFSCFDDAALRETQDQKDLRTSNMLCQSVNNRSRQIRSLRAFVLLWKQCPSRRVPVASSLGFVPICTTSMRSARPPCGRETRRIGGSSRARDQPSGGTQLCGRQ